RIEVPQSWNGDLVLYAHGWHGGSSLTVDDLPIRALVVQQGFAWAASSFSVGGYVPEDGVKDTLALRDFFSQTVGAPKRTYIYGTSMGGHIVVASLEQHPAIYAGGLSECGVVNGVGGWDYFAAYTLLVAYFGAVHLSDSAVLCLMVLAQWEAHRSERAFLRYVRQHWSSYFPRLLSQSAFNRRARDLWGVLCQLAPTLAQSWTLPASECETYAVLDGVPVPLMRCCRGRQHRLFAGEANLGRGGSDQAWYCGIKLLSVVSPQRGITGFVYGPANTEERWLAEALFRWRADAYATAPTAAQLARVLGPAHRRHGQRYGPSG